MSRLKDHTAAQLRTLVEKGAAAQTELKTRRYKKQDAINRKNCSAVAQSGKHQLSHRHGSSYYCWGCDVDEKDLPEDLSP